jgi:hypothetical protein
MIVLQGSRDQEGISKSFEMPRDRIVILHHAVPDVLRRGRAKNRVPVRIRRSLISLSTGTPAAHRSKRAAYSTEASFVEFNAYQG